MRLRIGADEVPQPDGHERGVSLPGAVVRVEAREGVRSRAVCRGTSPRRVDGSRTAFRDVDPAMDCHMAALLPIGICGATAEEEVFVPLRSITIGSCFVGSFSPGPSGISKSSVLPM